jgi:hypothetical protein
MNSSLAVQEKTAAQLAVDHAKDAISSLVLKGDTSKLTNEEKVQYYNAVCQSLGLNPSTRPFEFLNFQATEDKIENGKVIKEGKGGKEVLYPNKNCAEQLRMLRGVSLSGAKFTFESNKQVIIAEVTAKTRDGREDTDFGIVDRTSGKDKWLSLGDAMMKATTKAKRRVTFSILGLGFFDEIAQAIDDSSVSVASIEDISLSQLHGIEYMASEQFKTLTELAKAAQLMPDAMGLYFLSKYPGRSRGEIPADDFDAIAADFSNEEIVSHWNNRATPDPRVSIE